MVVVAALKTEKGVITSNVNNARGIGKITPLAYRGFGEQTEKEILNVVVAHERADEVFEYIYHKAEINQPHGGLMYMSRLQQSTSFVLPELPDEK